MKFDLPQIDTKSLADTGVLMTVTQFDGDEPLIAKNGEPVRIRLRGPDSDVYREFTRKQIQKRFARGNDPKRLNELDMEEVEKDSLDMLAAMTVGWENVLDTDGTEIPFSVEVARALYVSYPVVREQVDTFVANRRNFLRASLEN